MTEQTILYRGIYFTFPDSIPEAVAACPNFAWCVYQSFLDEKAVSCPQRLESNGVRVDCGTAARVRNTGNRSDVVAVQGQKAACLFLDANKKNP